MISCRVSPKTSFSARLGRIRFSNNRQLKYRDEVIGRAKKNSESISQDIPTENLPSEGKVQKDFWEVGLRHFESFLVGHWLFYCVLC